MRENLGESQCIFIFLRPSFTKSFRGYKRCPAPPPLSGSIYECQENQKQSHHKRGERVHGVRPQIGQPGIETTDQGMNDERRVLGEVEHVGQVVDALEGPASDAHGNFGAVEEPDDGRQKEVHVVVEGAAELLKGRQQLAGHVTIGAVEEQ